MTTTMTEVRLELVVAGMDTGSMAQAPHATARRGRRMKRYVFTRQEALRYSIGFGVCLSILVLFILGLFSDAADPDTQLLLTLIGIVVLLLIGVMATTAYRTLRSAPFAFKEKVDDADREPLLKVAKPDASLTTTTATPAP